MFVKLLVVELLVVMYLLLAELLMVVRLLMTELLMVVELLGLLSVGMLLVEPLVGLMYKTYILFRKCKLN